jgi:hypothetical protein
VLFDRDTLERLSGVGREKRLGELTDYLEERLAAASDFEFEVRRLIDALVLRDTIFGVGTRVMIPNLGSGLHDLCIWFRTH